MLKSVNQPIRKKDAMALVTGKPVYVFEPRGGSAKFSRFHAGLAAHGATRIAPAPRPGAPPPAAGAAPCPFRRVTAPPRAAASRQDAGTWASIHARVRTAASSGDVEASMSMRRSSTVIVP